MFGRESARDIALRIDAEARIRSETHEKRHDQLDMAISSHAAETKAAHTETAARVTDFHKENQAAVLKLRDDVNGLAERLHGRITGIIWWINGTQAAVIAAIAGIGLWILFGKTPGGR